MPLPKFDSLIADYLSRISTLEKLNRDYTAEKELKLKEIDKKTKDKIDRLKKELEKLEAESGSEINKFYENFGAQKKQLENKINRETAHLQDWTTKLTKSKDIVVKLEAAKEEKTNHYNEKLAELERKKTEDQSEYDRIVQRLITLDQEARKNYAALNDLPPLDIDKITHESNNRISAYTNEILWAQIHNTNETFTLSNLKIELDKKIDKLISKIAKATEKKEKDLKLLEAELEEPRSTFGYNEKNLNKYKAMLDRTRDELQKLLDTEEPFKGKNEANKKKAIQKIKAKIKALENQIPEQRDKIIKDYDAMIAANEKTIRNLKAQLKKTELWESQLKNRLNELK